MQRNRRIRRLWVVMLLFVIAAPFLAFGLSNLYLISPKGRLFVASKIKQRIGLETSLQGSSWSPWNGLTLYGMRVEQPPPLSSALEVPLLTVESIRIAPAWGTLLRNRLLLVKGIDIRKPKLNAPVELFSQISSSPPPVPSIAANDPGQSAPRAGSAPQATTNLPHTGTTVIPLEPPFHEEKTITSIKSKEQPAPPTLWINFSDADLRLISTLNKEPLYELSQADGGFPVGGKSAKKNITIREVRCLGNEIGSNISVPLKWTSPVLEIGAINGKFFGMDCSVKADIRLTNGMPFQIIAAMPEQQNKEFHWGEATQAKFGKVSGKGRMQGFLGRPASWQGQWILQTISVDAAHTDRTAHFDYGQALVIFRNGALSCVDARLIGDSMSILGNATLLSDGRAAANARIIAAPEALVAVSKVTQIDSSAPTLTPLSTPQRSALDLQLFGKLGEFFYKPNLRAAPIPLQ